MKGDSLNQENEKKVSGEITSIRGSVVDFAFPEKLPPINSLIRTGENGSVIIEAAIQRTNSGR